MYVCSCLWLQVFVFYGIIVLFWRQTLLLVFAFCFGGVRLFLICELLGLSSLYYPPHCGSTGLADNTKKCAGFCESSVIWTQSLVPLEQTLLAEPSPEATSVFYFLVLLTPSDTTQEYSNEREVQPTRNPPPHWEKIYTLHSPCFNLWIVTVHSGFTYLLFSDSLISGFIPCAFT